MCHWNHAYNYWHVALLLTKFAGTFIDPFDPNTILAQSAKEPKSTTRATQQSAVLKLKGVSSPFLTEEEFIVSTV